MSLLRGTRRSLFGGGWAKALLFNGASTFVNHSSDADLDDLHDAEMTIEAWIRREADTTQYIISKRGDGATDGWVIYTGGGGEILAIVYFDTDYSQAKSSSGFLPADAGWRHVTMYFNDAGDRKVYLAVDGVWETSYQTQTAGSDPIDSDAANDLLLGKYAGGSSYVDGAIGWYRISNNDRYSHGTDFVPAKRPPASDANTVLLCHVDEGIGTALDNEQGDAGRDGTITNGVWVRGMRL